MNESSRKKLQSVLSSLEIEANNVAVELENSQKELVDLEKVIDELANSFSENDVIFSPRRDRFPSGELKQKRESLDQKKRHCEEIHRHYDELNDNIEIIVDVLSHDNDKMSNNSGLLFHEQDRQRIARDLHEVAVQNLSFLVERMDSCIANVERDPVNVKMDLSMARKSLVNTIDNIRSVVYDLRPANSNIDDFRKEILDFIAGFNQNGQFQIETEIEDFMCHDQLLLRTLYQIIEECFYNIKKHADAYSIHLIIQEQIGLLYIYVEDDGKGFDVNRVMKERGQRFGLSIMKERVGLLGGNINIDSAENGGTRIKILIPFSGH